MTTGIPDWAIQVPNYPVHTEPARAGGDILPPFTWQQMQEYFAQFMEAFIRRVAMALGGIFLPGGDGYQYLVDWALGIAEVLGLGSSADFVGPLDLEAIWTAITEDFIQPLEMFAELIDGFLPEWQIPLLDATHVPFGLFPQSQIFGLEDDLASLGAAIASGDPQQIIDALMNAMGHPGTGYDTTDLFNAFVEEVLQIESPLNSLNLFNLVPTDLMAHVPISNIGTALTNLITDPTFLDAEHFSGGGIYFHDNTDGHAGAGCVYTVADGSGAKELLSNLIPVSPDQVLPISGWAKWSGLTAAGGTFPVQLNVTGYLPGGATQQATIDQRSAVPPTTDWTYLSGSYTVPADVTGIRVRLTVTPAATAGTVKWDDLSATKSGPLIQRLIAGTNVGDLLPDDIENLFNGIVSNALAIVDRALQGDLTALQQALDPSGTLANIEARINSFLDSLSPLNADNINSGNVADQFVAGLTSINDNIVTKLLNISGAGFGHTDAGNALQHNTFALVDASARLAQLETTLTGGVADGDDFERTSSTSLGTGWLTYYGSGGGTWATPNGHDASWIPAGLANREFVAIRNTGQIRSTTIYQRGVLVLGSKATEWFGWCGHNDIWLRISDTTTSLANITGIRYRFGGDGSASICRFVNGVNLDAGTPLAYIEPFGLTPPGPGSSIWAEAGEPGTARYFHAGIGTSTLLYAQEVGAASVADSTALRWGHGGRAEWNITRLAQEQPGAVHQETRMDQLA